MKDEKPIIGTYGAGVLAALFSTITNGEVRGLFRAGKYLDCLWTVLIFAVVAYMLFAVGYTGLGMVLGTEFAKKHIEKHRRAVLYIGSLIVYFVFLWLTVLWFKE